MELSMAKAKIPTYFSITDQYVDPPKGHLRSKNEYIWQDGNDYL